MCFYLKCNCNSALHTTCKCMPMQTFMHNLFAFALFTCVYCTIRCFFFTVANSWVAQPWFVPVSVECLAISMDKPLDFKFTTGQHFTIHSQSQISTGSGVQHVSTLSVFFNHTQGIFRWDEHPIEREILRDQPSAEEEDLMVYHLLELPDVQIM